MTKKIAVKARPQGIPRFLQKNVAVNGKSKLIMGVIMYFISKCNNNLTYSIDMIRLRTDLTVGDFSKFKLKMMAIYKKYLIKECVSTAISDFRYNFTVEVE